MVWLPPSPPVHCPFLHIHFRCQHGDSPTLLGAEAPPPPAFALLKFGFSRDNLVSLSTPSSDSPHAGNGCQDLPRA